jgi:hypothetical protein
MDLIKRIKRALAKAKVRDKWAKFEALTKREKHVISIVITALSDSENIFHLAPISGLMFIRMPEKDMFIIMEGTRVIISNHKFYYDIQVKPWVQDLLSKRFNKVMDRQRLLIEKDLLETITEGLGNIEKYLKDKNGSTTT